MTVTVAQINGVMNLFVWQSLPAIGNLASNMLPVIAVGCTLLFLRQVFSLSVNFYWYDRLMSTIGWAPWSQWLRMGSRTDLWPSGFPAHSC